MDWHHQKTVKASLQSLGTNTMLIAFEIIMIACGGVQGSDRAELPVGFPNSDGVSLADRIQEINRLRARGLVVPASGPVLVNPFKLPFSRRSFVVPGQWFRDAQENPKTTVVASKLVKDLLHLQNLMYMAYGGWDSAIRLGHNWAQWFKAWRMELESRGSDEIPLDEAFEPIKRLMDIQLDNHTNILGLETGSGSQSAHLAKVISGPCDLARHASGQVFQLSIDDKGQ